MKKALHQDSRGIAHVALIALAVVVLGVVGFAGWRVMQKKDQKTNSSGSQDLAQLIANAKCDYDDKDLCKFLTGWKETKQFKVVSTDTAEGQTTTNTVMQDDGKLHLIAGGEVSYEMISMNDTTYTKAPNGTWWKQTVKATAKYDYKFEEPTESGDEENTEPAKKTEYKKLGKEACGNLQCFKYEVVEADSPDSKQFIWFDDKDYQLRRMRLESKDTTSDAVFSYDKVSVNVPSPVRDLAPNQYLMPGQNEPQTLPSQEDVQNMYQ